MLFRSARVRYSETGIDSKIRLQSILNYFQDCALFHSEELGVGMNYLGDRGYGWVLSSWQIYVERYPELFENIRIGTFPYDFHGFLGYRNFYMEDQEGVQIVKANSLWTFLDLKKGRPARIMDEIKNAYSLGEKLSMAYAPRKIKTPGKQELKEPILVKQTHLDSNHHVNNGQYVQMAWELLPKDYYIRQVRVEYKKSAGLDHWIIPKIGETEGAYVICLEDENKDAYALVEFC